MRKTVLWVSAFAALVAFSAEVVVDWNVQTGPVKPVNGVGQPPMVGAPSSFRMMHYLKRAGIPYSRLHDVGGAYGGMRYVDIPNIFRDFDADENDPKNYDFAATDRLMESLSANGVEPFYRLGVTIENAAGAGFPAYRIFPPKDYAKWARICEHVIRHYTEGWADGYRMKVTHWEIWNEPENHPDPERNPMFRAPFDEYMRLYGTVAPYLKSKFPHLKIGGYGHCGFYAAVGSDRVPAANTSPRMEYFVECSHRFLKAAKEKGWPLDFFSYHSYSDPVEALRQVRYARELLDSYGFKDVPTCFNEWLPRPSLASRGTPHQAAMIAAELIGLQNGPCDMAMIYDARCGTGNYSPLFNPLTEKPHKAYFAFLAFNSLYRLGTAVKAASSDTNLWVAAARKDRQGAIMMANYSKRDIPLDLKADGLRQVSWNITSPKHWDAYFRSGPPKSIPADSFVVVFFNDMPPTWGRPKTTRRYLHGPLASRLAVMFREGKLLLGDCVHVHDWHEIPYSTVMAHGVWLTHGKDAVPFDFREAVLKQAPDAVPIAAQVWREGDLEVEVEGCAPFGRFPNAHMRVKVTNHGKGMLEDSLSFLVRQAPEQELVHGAPDGYVHYDPGTGAWIALPSGMRPSKDPGTLREGTAFVSFGKDAPFEWNGRSGVARVAFRLAPGETRSIDCVVGRGDTELPHYDEVREQVRRDWLKELERVDGRSPLVRNLTVQMLQCFSRPAKGDYILPRQGGLQRWVWPGDQRSASAALDRLGYGDYVEKTVEFYFGQYLQPNGEVGKFGNGWASDTASTLMVFAGHALTCGDAAFWKRHRDAASKAYGWIRDTREKDGLFPPLKSADSDAVFRNWGATDCTNLEALELFAKAARHFGDPVAAEAEKTAADYRAAMERCLDRWRKAAAGKDELFIPFSPDGSNEERFSRGFYYSHPGHIARLGFFDEDELLRIRRWLVRTGVANEEKGLYMISRDGVVGRGAEGNFWYMTWAEHDWFKAWLRVGREDLARQALSACLKYAMTDEYIIGERYQAADPWLFPWSPNASGSGRIIQMILDLEESARFISPAETNSGCNVAVYRKTFVNAKRVKRARLEATGQGVFRIFANGREIGGDDFLKPGNTSLEKCRHVYGYDVTDMLDCAKGSENTITATVSPTWWCDAIYAPRPKTKYPWKLGRNVALRARLHLLHDDGTSSFVSTGPDWLSAYSGPLRFADLYHGEVVDAREAVKDLKPSKVNREFDGEFRPPAARIVLRDDLTMPPMQAYVVKGVEGAAEGAFGKAKVVRRYGADEDMALDKGEMLVLDFGQNASAVPSFTVKGAGGVKLHLRHSEMLNEANGEKSRGNDGPAGTPYVASLRSARAEIWYTLKDGEQSYRPGYTFFGYRYVGVTATGPVVFRGFRSVPVTSVTKAMERGRIVTGDARVNRLISNIRWGMLSNYLSSPTDCPQRDERLGWTADTQVFVDSAAYLADTYGFLGKYLQDMRDGQYPDGLYTCFVPNVRHVFQHWASCGWTDAGILIPYRLWKWYGRREVLDDCWDSMERYMDFLRVNEKPYRINHADWLAYEHKDKRPRADNRAQDPVYKEVMNAYFPIWMARLMREMAAATGRDDRAASYARFEKELTDAFKREYVGEDGTIKDYWKGQCSDLYMLKLGLCGNAAAAEATKKDLVANIRAHGNRLQTGFLGTAILMPTLTFDADAPEVAYDLLFQDKDPSWLYSVDQGATTVWERWNSYTKEKGFGPTSMNSFNHYAYGCVLEWLYSAAAGIRRDPATVGWRHFLLHPYADKRLGGVDATYDSPVGRIASEWKYGADGKLTWKFEIPEGATATVTPPWGGAPKEYSAGRYELAQ